MNRKLALYDLALGVTLGRTHVALADIDTFYDHTGFQRVYSEDFSALSFIIAADNDDVVVLLDMQLNLFDTCFHFSLI